jgi:hypothetical protein
VPRPDPIKLIFKIERDTKNKVRFEEVIPIGENKAGEPVPKDKAVVEKLYVSKKELKRMGNPELLYVTIESP